MTNWLIRSYVNLISLCLHLHTKKKRKKTQDLRRRAMALHTTILQKITINSPCVAHGIRKLNGPNRGPRPNGTDDFFFEGDTDEF